MTEANIQDLIQLHQKVNDGYTQAFIVKKNFTTFIILIKLT